MFAEMDAVSTLWEVIDVCVMMDIKLARPGKNVSVRFLFFYAIKILNHVLKNAVFGD